MSVQVLLVPPGSNWRHNNKTGDRVLIKGVAAAGKVDTIVCCASLAGNQSL